MLFMAIYVWEPGQSNELVKRRIEKGMLREGLKELGEWTVVGGGIGFLLVESKDPKAFISGSMPLGDHMAMEVFPVIETGEMMKVAKRQAKVQVG
jgi:hypothetical protein